MKPNLRKDFSNYETQWESLEETENPFGLVVMAHLKTKATSQNLESRMSVEVMIS